MKTKIMSALIALLGLTTALNAQTLNGNDNFQGNRREEYPQQRGNDYPQQNSGYNQQGGGYNKNPNNGGGYYGNDDDLYGRRQGNQYGNYPFDNRNPFDTRSQNYDPRNPFDPRPVYDQNRHGRWNDYDYRYNGNAYDYCPNRQAWANRYYPIDPRNPYDVRNIYQNRGNGYGYNNNNGYGRRGRERHHDYHDRRGW